MKFFEKQGWHLAALVVLLAGVAWASQIPAMQSGVFWGAITIFWFWLAVFVPVVHQVYVWLAWRSELTSKFVTHEFGKAGFPLYGVGFFVLFFGRFFSILGLSVANREQMDVNVALRWSLGLLFTVLGVYLMYSVLRYFTIPRALGIDHFDESYRGRPFVRGGIFKYTPNAMYVVGFLILYVPGLLLASPAALLAAAFNHLYIWVHYYTVEKPDMAFIYGRTT